ncbi:flagellar biosynthesis protein FlhA [Gluconobacter sp. OJB]|uniref:flagellar biosynthesis protein FlhA n=1 Tax=Gluconobacter sp. OJB TaxID=3145196 RepID=UPI0031F91A81
MSDFFRSFPGLSSIQKKIPGSDVGLAVFVAGLLSVLIFPLPTFILDIGLAISITLAILILMVALFLKRPLDFTSFPILLLLTTLLRLSLEVATTRLILSHGYQGLYSAGHVVAAFGGFLMGGDVVIGAILFSILLVVNFMVITKGSGRISEVSARFFLDSMPGKQMAIDAELSSGSINNVIAKKKRKELEEESSFYGAMDGASKFVRGDAIASLIITVINIVGGLTIGIVRHGMTVSDAAAAFTTLTIGDGLVSQIPALLVSAASGIVVTKGGTEGGADVVLIKQLGGNAKPLILVAVCSLVLAIMPGLPAFPFLFLAILSALASWFRYVFPIADKINEDDSISVPEEKSQTDIPISNILRVDLLKLELGFNLLPIANIDNSSLTEKIKLLRRTIAADVGFVLPPVRIQDNLNLPPDRYSLCIKEIEVGSGNIKVNKLLAMDPQGREPDIEGEKTIEPAFGLSASWIDQNLRENAIIQGYTVVDPSSVIITHLTELIKDNMADLLSYSETQKLLDGITVDQQKLISDLIPSQISVSNIQRILQSLLEERVSIRDLIGILESIQDGCSQGLKTVSSLVAHVRIKLARQISSCAMNSQGYIPVILLSPNWENIIYDNFSSSKEGGQINFSPSQMNKFISSLRTSFGNVSKKGELPILLVSNNIRIPIRRIVERINPSVSVLAQEEIFPRVKVQNIEIIN